MSKRLARVLGALALTGLVVGVAVAGAQSRNNEFAASMRGSAESPRGPANARGTFTVEFRNGQACYRMSVQALGSRPVAAHIHKGNAGTNGGIVIDLRPTFRGTSPRISEKCVPARATIVSAIRRNPRGYYANVHTQKNPAGAARGQLRIDDRGND
jgi:CHRD domain-containing protein